MLEVTIYHNPRCSKSRETLGLLQERGVEPTIIEYLNDPPDEATLERLLDQLGMRAGELVRTKEEAFAQLGLDPVETDPRELIRAMVAHPILIERPIVVRGDRARLGRPPERVLELL